MTREPNGITDEPDEGRPGRYREGLPPEPPEEDEAAPRARSIRKELTGLDAMFAKTPLWVLGLFGCLCGVIAVALGIAGLIVCEDEKARLNALYTFVVGGALTAFGVFGWLFL